MSKEKNTSADNNDPNGKPIRKKSKFLRRILRIFAWFLAVLLIMLALLVIFRDTIIKNTVTGVGSWLTGVDIAMENFETSLTRGELKINNLKIANPAGYDKSHMFELSSFYVNIDLPSLFTDKIIVEEIDVNGMNLVAEFKRNGKFNAVEITENIQNKIPAPAEADAKTVDKEAVAEEDNDNSGDTPSSAPEPAQKTVAIHRIDVSNSSATVYDDRVGIPVSVPLVYSSIDLQLSASGEALVTQLHNLALQLQYACSGVANAGELVVDTGKQLLDTTGDAGKKIINTTGDAGKILLDSTTDAGRQITESGKKLLDAFKF